MDPSGSIRVGRKELRNKEEQGQVIRAEAESLLLRSIRFIGPHFPLFLSPPSLSLSCDYSSLFFFYLFRSLFSSGRFTSLMG